VDARVKPAHDAYYLEAFSLSDMSV